MSTLANIPPPAANLNLPDHEPDELPSQNESEGFDNVMSKALLPPPAAPTAVASSLYSPSSSKRPLSLNPQPTNDHSPNVDSNQPQAVSTKNPTTADSAGVIHKSESARATDAKNATSDPTQTTSEPDNSQNIPIQFLAPTFMAMLLSAPGSAGSAMESSGGSSVAAKIAAINGVADVASSGKGQKPSGGKQTGDTKAAAADVAPQATSTANVAAAVKNLGLSTDVTATPSGKNGDNADKIAGAKLTAAKNDLVTADTEKHVNKGDSSKTGVPTTTILAGTAVAKEDVTMKKAENTNNDAGQNEKVLPGDNFSIARVSNSLTADSASTASHDQPTASNIISLSSALDHSTAASVSDAVAVTNLSDLRSRSMERTHDMVTMNALRLVNTQSDSMQVVIKPGAGTQLSLELRQRGDVIEAQAVLQHGDFQNLNQHWPDLQQRLEQKGIKLGALTSDETSLTYNGHQGNSQKQSSSPEQDALFASAFAEFSLAGAAHVISAPVLATLGGKGWETWA
jgi:hypothetical protein